MKEPFVSICVPNYNKEEYIGETIKSILDQTYKNFELIISDNASTDNSMEVINSFNDPRIKVYSNDTNIGAVANANKCIDYAKGDHIAVFHADDIYHKQIVEFEAKSLSAFADVGIVSSNKADNIDEFRKRQNENFSLDAKCYTSLNFTKLLFSGVTLVNVSVMVKRECYEQFGKFDEALLETIDQEYYLRLSSKYGLVFIANDLVFKRYKPCPDSLDYHKLWLRGYEVWKETGKAVYNASTKKEELKKLYTFFLATQNRNISRRSLLIGDYKRAKTHLLLYMQNKLEITRNEHITKWIKSIDDAPI